jgi:uncharacterized protein (TIGR04255 family)
MTTDPSAKHTRFDHPPVVETVLGLRFNSLLKWEVPFFGLFWATIRDRYPKYRVVPSLGTTNEDVDPSGRMNVGISVNILQGSPPCRLWYYNDAETELVQVQPDRFIFNWKRGLIAATYPHFDNIRPSFESEWMHFRDFVILNDLGEIRIKECEITYINHIESGVGWEGLGELDNVLVVWSGTKESTLLPSPEVVNLRLRYLLPGNKGRLEVLAEPAIRNDDNKGIVQLTMIARGAPETSDVNSVLEWFDFAQAFVREAFVDLTTRNMHSIWGIRDRS